MLQVSNVYDKCCCCCCTRPFFIESVALYSCPRGALCVDHWPSNLGPFGWFHILWSLLQLLWWDIFCQGHEGKVRRLSPTCRSLSLESYVFRKSSLYIICLVLSPTREGPSCFFRATFPYRAHVPYDGTGLTTDVRRALCRHLSTSNAESLLVGGVSCCDCR